MDKKMNNKQINTIKLTDKHLHVNYNNFKCVLLQKAERNDDLFQYQRKLMLRSLKQYSKAVFIGKPFKNK